MSNTRNEVEFPIFWSLEILDLLYLYIQCQYLEILRATIYQVEEFHIQRCDLFKKLFTIKCISIEKTL